MKRFNLGSTTQLDSTLLFPQVNLHGQAAIAKPFVTHAHAVMVR